MNWIRENKFLTGFFAALIIGVGVLGYLVYSASASFGEVSDTYKKQSDELKRLQAMAPYPDEKNLATLRAEKDAYLAGAAELQKSLTTIEYPLQPMTPEQFQDKLRAAVSKVSEMANAAGVHLPANFYLGFDVPTNYQTTLPKPEVAAPLGKQLDAIQFLVERAIEAKVDTLTGLVRSPLPAEGGATPAPANEGRNPRPNAGAPAKNLVDKGPVILSFLAEQPRFRRWLNDVSSAKNQFYIIRLLTVKNENPKGASRATPAPELAPAAAETVDGAVPGATPAPANTLRFVVGTEKVNVTAKIDIVDFAPPSTPAGK